MVTETNLQQIIPIDNIRSRVITLVLRQRDSSNLPADTSYDSVPTEPLQSSAIVNSLANQMGLLEESFLSQLRLLQVNGLTDAQLVDAMRLSIRDIDVMTLRNEGLVTEETGILIQ